MLRPYPHHFGSGHDTMEPCHIFPVRRFATAWPSVGVVGSLSSIDNPACRRRWRVEYFGMIKELFATDPAAANLFFQYKGRTARDLTPSRGCPAS